MATPTIIRYVTEALLNPAADLAGVLGSSNIVAAPPETVDKATTTQTLPSCTSTRCSRAPTSRTPARR